MHKIDSVVEFLHELCRTNELGGQIRVVSPCSCVITDISSWTYDMTCRLESRFTSVEVDVERCTESLGGFAVRVRLEDIFAHQVIITSITFAIMAVLVAFSLNLMPSVLSA
jgi:hypothetical protein